MAIDLRSFKQAANEDIGRPNAYEVRVQDWPEYMQIFCNNAEFPDQTMVVASAYFQGRELKLAGEIRYEPITLSWYGATKSGTMEIYQRLCEWFNLPRNPITNFGSNSPSEYWKQVRILTLDYSRRRETEEIILLDAWVSKIPKFSLSAASEGQLLEIQVELSFSEMETFAVGSAPSTTT